MRARRHLRAEGSRVVLHDDRSGNALQLGEREWAVVSSLDGTRSLAGVVEAAAQRGTRVSEAHVKAFVDQLGALGFFDAAETHPESVSSSFARDLPIETLPGWGYRCDGRGGCCQTFSTVIFTPLEAAVARATLPDHHDAGVAPGRFFTPEHGLDASLYAAPLERGRCSYLDRERRCQLHAAAGPTAKPQGCRTHPLRFLDVGTHIRCAPRPECACLFVPADGVDGVPSAGAQLPRETYVPRLQLGPLGIANATRDTPIGALLDWLDGLPPPDEDGAAYLERVAQALRTSGITAPASRSRTPRAAPPDVRARATRLAAQRASLDLADDLVRRAATWIADAQPTGSEPPGPGERLYVRALLYAPPDSGSLPDALMRAAARLRLARALDPNNLDDPAASPPIALLEAMLRGYALDD
ncbi:MAG: YkgJ family cysteine cluster protein [Sandaracinaceae bacterium]